ncbi:MAG: hypothetical protein IMZ69_08100, partial [Spirochaetes bacterium]|nr:hypothetical protein [Spirochaetota bacterium]
SILYNGSDFEENVARLADENEKLAEANKALKPEPPVIAAPAGGNEKQDKQVGDQLDEQDKQEQGGKG